MTRLPLLLPLLATACLLGPPTGSTEVSAAPPATPVEPAVRAVGGIPVDLPDVAERVVQSVVSVKVDKPITLSGYGLPFDDEDVERWFPGLRGSPRAPRHTQGMGSGVIVDAQGIVVTNNHVIDGATKIEIVLPDGTEVEGTLVGADPLTDIAVVRLVNPPKNLVALPFGDSDSLRLGQIVLAAGNPFAVGQTVTMGIVSATGRTDLGIVDYEDFIQTDAAINPGNSGGALVDLRGELVGIPTAIYSRSGGSNGIGFAIPSSMARAIVDDLLDDGAVARGWLGVGIQDLDTDLARLLGADADRGVVLNAVQSGSPAEASGAESGDVVVRFNGAAMDDAEQFRRAVAAADPGSRFTLEVVRNGKRKTLDGALAERPGDPATPAPEEPPEAPSQSAVGLVLRSVDPSARAQLGLPDRIEGGVVVARVIEDSPAARAGLRDGDVIVSVNRTPVQTPADVAGLLEKGGDRALVLVAREGSTLFRVIER